MTTTCKSCGAKIFFAKTPAGKPIPVDLVPAEKGNLIVRRVQAGLVAVPLRRAGALAADEVAHVSHFATCAQADQWRKP